MELRHASVIRGGVAVLRIIAEGLWMVAEAGARLWTVAEGAGLWMVAEGAGLWMVAEAGARLCTTVRGWCLHRDGVVDTVTGMLTP